MMGQLFVPLSGKQNVHYLADIFKCILLKENICIFIQISLRKFVANHVINYDIKYAR